MNQGRIWCVVSPTVGLPLFLGSIAATSLIVHTAVLTHTTWYGNLYQGKARENPNVSLKGGASGAALASATAQPGFTISVAPQPAADQRGGTSFVVTVSPSAAPASAPVQLAAAPSGKTLLAQSK